MNPFQLVFNALWELIDTYPSFFVKDGNKVKFNVDGDRGSRIKQSVQPADLPELILVGNTSQFNLHETSTSSKVVRQYSWLISTGDMRYTTVLAHVEWQLLCAHARWKEVLGGLVWNSKSFVKDSRLVSGSMGQSDAERNRGITGWSSIISVEVTMHFATADLLEV